MSQLPLFHAHSYRPLKIMFLLIFPLPTPNVFAGEFPGLVGPALLKSTPEKNMHLVPATHNLYTTLVKTGPRPCTSYCAFLRSLGPHSVGYQFPSQSQKHILKIPPLPTSLQKLQSTQTASVALYFSVVIYSSFPTPASSGQNGGSKIYRLQMWPKPSLP